NEHRKFIPTNVYPTSDGFVFLAIGSDAQWRRLVSIPKFATVGNEIRSTNEGRHDEREAIHRDMARVTGRYPSEEILADLRAATIPATRILGIREVRELPQLRDKLTRTTLPDGRVVHMQPMAVDLQDARLELSFAPRYGADTTRVLGEAGYSGEQVRDFIETGVAA
ncbi:MAG: CoA transferase, partial [Burkholderiaceae bacterium]|nr:CoA transferase [Burkholderiaceae bacterium]